MRGGDQGEGCGARLALMEGARVVSSLPSEALCGWVALQVWPPRYGEVGENHLEAGHHPMV